MLNHPRTCNYCGEPIQLSATEQSVADSRPFSIDIEWDGLGRNQGLHKECALRMIVGSLGHQLGICHCPGNAGIMDDPPGLTAREAARTAHAFYKGRCNGSIPADCPFEHDRSSRGHEAPLDHPGGDDGGQGSVH